MVNPEITAYVRTQILPRYAGFDAAHGVTHAEKVIDNSQTIASAYDVNADMVYVIAAYHDIGLAFGREKHEAASGALVRTDAALRIWFTDAQIQTMAEAVEDHRASNTRPPRSLYGRIVAEADRDIEYTTILTRTIQYSLRYFPEYDSEQHIDRCYAHIREKYGEGGYLTLWLDTEKNRRSLEELRRLIKDKVRFAADCKTIYDKKMRAGEC